MTRLTKYTIHLISGLLLALLTAGCVADRNVSDCVAEGDEVDIEFALKVPALETSLRQLSDEQESQVKSVKVLVFNTQDASGQTLAEEDETFAYVAKMTTTNFTPDQDGVTHVVCKLTASDKPMRIVCIANYDVPESILTVGTAKKTILEHAQMTRNFTEKWPTSGDKYHIPMWGESDAQPVNKGTRFNSCAKLAYGNAGQNRNNEGVIHLVRALARVDVGVNFEADPSSQTAAGSETFKIKSVRVYRYATSMYVAGTQATAFNFDGKRRNALPHTPEGVQAAKDAKPLEFTAQTVEDEKGYVRNIYIPEISNHLDNGQNKGKGERICLVVGGFYKGASKQTYYRVDFIKRETKSPNDIITKQLDILRNYRYRFNITDVKGPGTDTPEEALTTEPVNINWDVLVWDEGEIDEIMYDGQYYLIVSKDKFHFGKDATSESYTIRTNWEGGYQIVDKDGNEWPKAATDLEGTDKWAYFTATGSQKEIDKDMTSTVNVLENKSGADRSIPGPEQMNDKNQQQLFVKAGRIWWPLQITQSNKIELDIKLYEQLKDPKTNKTYFEPTSHIELKNGETKIVKVVYTKGATLERQHLVSGEEHFYWTLIEDKSEEGWATFTVEMPKDSAPDGVMGITEASRFRVDKQGATAHADLNVSFLKYDAVPYRDKQLTDNMTLRQAGYVLINEPGKFYIKANAPYKLEVVTITPSSTKSVSKELVVHKWKENLKIYEALAGHLTGDRIDFQPYDWINRESGLPQGDDNMLYAATVLLRISPTSTDKSFKPREFTIRLTAGIIQPEANCYIMKSTQKVPILIPLSRINTAAEWYSQWEEEAEKIVEDHISTAGKTSISNAQYKAYVADGKSALPRLAATEPVEANVIWSTITSSSTHNPADIKSGIKILKPVTVDGERYLLVGLTAKSKYDVGNAVVGVHRPEDKDKFLWSWHIWVVDEYPWKPVSGRSAMPFLNRNLGAMFYGHGYFAGGVSLNYTGLFYQFGRKDPFYIDTYPVVQPDKFSRKYPIFLGNKNDASDKSRYAMAALKATYGGAYARYTMKQLIRYPYLIATRDANDGYILEMLGANENYMCGTTLWQGQGVYTRHDDRARNNIQAATVKTPFDPSPYGWKVPSIGRLEMNKIYNIDPMFLTNNCVIKGGFAPKGIDPIQYVPDGWAMLHTATTDIGNVGNKAIFNNGSIILEWNASQSKWVHRSSTAASIMNAQSAGLPVRSILNENETDFQIYTEEGFYDAAR
ncbi:hypothetical protein [Porphyromonas vaginalis]|uniref:hypothetical protein n=1 Tax=Porphyromonas vaginalis TaxID=3044325 RepID=UPI00262A0F9D|nr:hypothetical protein [Porphyromonas vaginalis]